MRRTKQKSFTRKQRATRQHDRKIKDGRFSWHVLLSFLVPARRSSKEGELVHFLPLCEQPRKYLPHGHPNEFCSTKRLVGCDNRIRRVLAVLFRGPENGDKSNQVRSVMAVRSAQG